MREQLKPNGKKVSTSNVEISAVGFSGKVRVHKRGSAGMRGAEDTKERLLDALERCGYREQVTVEISEPRVHTVKRKEGRSKEPREPEITLTVPGVTDSFGQVLLACDEDGLLTWHFPEEAASIGDSKRRTLRNTYRIPAHKVGKPSTEKRGLIGAVGKKLFKVLAFALADKALGAAGNYFVSRYEQSRMVHRLRSFTADNYRNPEVEDMDSEAVRKLSSGKALLFIHGTASRTHKAFALLPEDLVSELKSRYQGRVFAFDHPTLSVSPTDNVKWLADTLKSIQPKSPLEVDIVAHSRGGLVGRVICECPAEAGLDSGLLSVVNLVMVATPNAGTPLANRKHLGSFVDTLTNCLEFFPDNPATDTLDIVLEVLKQIAVGVIGGLDGLQSMEPQGPFLQGRLNKLATVQAIYHAIAADYEPGPGTALSRYTRDYLTDLVFGGVANDLVVPTEGAYEYNGASNFPIKDVLRMDSVEMVEHSGFWDRPAVLAKLRNCLTGR